MQTIELAIANSADERVKAAQAALSYILAHYEVKIVPVPTVHINGRPVQLQIEDNKTYAPMVHNGESKQTAESEV